MRWLSAAQSHCGNVRSHNEDAVFAAADSGLWVVADGMGGHNAGEYASDAITRSLAEVTLTNDLAACIDAIEDRLLEVNDHLRQHARAECNGGTVGSTVVVLIERDGLAAVLWAGDSRLYRMRNDSVELITRDHSPVGDLYDSGGITAEELLANDTNVVTRAVGGQRELHLDVAVFDVEAEDTLLLCSDGLYREVEVPLMQEAMSMEVNSAVDLLMGEVLAGTAKDNVSLVVARAQA